MICHTNYHRLKRIMHMMRAGLMFCCYMELKHEQITISDPFFSRINVRFVIVFDAPLYFDHAALDISLFFIFVRC